MLMFSPSVKIKVSESGLIWQKSMVPISMAGMKKLAKKFACNVKR